MRNPTGYYRPQTVSEAVALLMQRHITTVALAGGALRLASEDELEFEAVVDLQDIAELSAISETSDHRLHIGAGVSLETFVNHPACPAMLRQVIRRVVPLNRRNGISVGELIDFQAELAEVTAALMALGTVVIMRAPDEGRVVLADWPAATPSQGLIIGLEVPLSSSEICWGAAHVARTPADEAIVSAAAVLVVEEGMVTEARLALSGLWSAPARLAQAGNLLHGNALDGSAIASVLDALRDEVAPVGDYLGSEAYRRAMAVVIARRALEQCQARLG